MRATFRRLLYGASLRRPLAFERDQPKFEFGDLPFQFAEALGRGGVDVAGIGFDFAEAYVGGTIVVGESSEQAGFRVMGAFVDVIFERLNPGLEISFGERCVVGHSQINLSRQQLRQCRFFDVSLFPSR